MDLAKINEIKNDPAFAKVIDYLRENVLACPDQVADALDLDRETVARVFKVAQMVVSQEVEGGDITSNGADIALGFVNDFLK